MLFAVLSEIIEIFSTFKPQRRDSTKLRYFLKAHRGIFHKVRSLNFVGAGSSPKTEERVLLRVNLRKSSFLRPL